MDFGTLMAFHAIQNTFNNGEISPLLRSRSDIEFWQKSLLECTNFQVLLQGGIRRRSGTRFVTEVADSSQQSRLLPFVFNADQAYVLDVNGGGTIRFVADRAYLVSGVSPYSIAHGWSASDLRRLNTAQANDVMYVAHPDYEPQKIQRMGDIDWSIVDTVFKDGPYLDTNITGTSLEPAERGSAVPLMTSNTTPSGTVSSDGGTTAPYVVFDGDLSNDFEKTTPTGIITYTFPAGTTKVVDAYWLRSPSAARKADRTPNTWKFQGFNGTDWVTLDSRAGESGWSAGEVRYYSFINETAYEAYRITWTSTDDIDDSFSAIGELGFHERGDNQTPFNLVASGTTGINGGAGFKTTDVDRLIRLLGSDTRWRWAKITSLINAAAVKIRLYDHSLPDTDPITQWALGSFSDESGWPGTVQIYDERLMWARTDTQPLSVFGSKQGIFDDYGISTPAVETDGINFTLLSSNMNEILWLADDEDLITGSAQQIRSIGPADFTKAFSAINLTQKKGPTTGAYFLQPITVGGTVLYIGRGAKKLRELVLGDQNRYVAPELSILGAHMLDTGVVEWAFSENPEPVIYAVTADGDLISIAYDRQQQVVGFARQQIAGGAVESVAVIPGTVEGYDDVYLVVRRTINGQTKRYIEVLENAFDGETATINDAFFVDSGLSYSGAAITTVSGLNHLEGESVIALADGGVVRDLTVSGGEVTLPNAASNIVVGIPYTSRAVTLPVAGPQSDGTLFGRRRKVTKPSIDVMHSGSMKVGAYGSDDWTPDLYEALMKRGDELFGNAIALVSGFQKAEITSSWAEGGGSIVMETDEPLPLLVRSVVLQLESEP